MAIDDAMRLDEAATQRLRAETDRSVDVEH